MIKKPSITPPRSLALFSWNTHTQTLPLVDDRAREARTVLIVSPFPEELTSAAFALQARITRLEGVPQTAGRTLRLWRYSLAGIYSFAAPTPLAQEIYPDLHVESSLEMPGLSTKVLSAAMAGLETPLHVVIDMPGYEGEVLTLLEEAKHIETIDLLTLRSMRGTFFEGVEDTPALVSRLQKLGFKLISRDDTCDPNWPILTFVVDHVARSIARLQASLGEREETLDARDAAVVESREQFYGVTKGNASNDKAFEEARVALAAKDSFYSEVDIALKHNRQSMTLLESRTEHPLLAKIRVSRERLRLALEPNTGQSDSTRAEGSATRMAAPTGLKRPRTKLMLGATLEHLLRFSMAEQFPPDLPRLLSWLEASLADEVNCADSLDRAVEMLPPREAALLLLAAAAHYAETGDRLLALDRLADASDAMPLDVSGSSLEAIGADLYLRLNAPSMALALLARNALQGPSPISDQSRQSLKKLIFDNKKSQDSEHGHVVLVDWINEHRPDRGQRLLVEIGTTRERVPGQGSTEKLALACRDWGFDFVTIDMDPRNAARAQKMFRRQDLRFQAVAAKGEEWLANYRGKIDYVFLDAYDFDHGKHSLQRQARYETYLGERINDAACHAMHLACAISLAEKLSQDGLVCIDDTWQDDNGQWTAKGTTAVPYLLSNGFRVVAARNRASLLARV